MSLALYNKKRNFKATPEPPGKTGPSRSKLSFVVQRHKATRLHYDFRLELDGVLKSWAVPKGPSLNPRDKRLAMMVEDHPYDYKDFEGIIPEGNYGAGIVEIWDKGKLSDLDNSEKKLAEKNLRAGIRAGNLKFRLHGKKLEGEYALVKLNNSENAWLLIKHKDAFATTKKYDSEDQTAKNSPINQSLSEQITTKRRNKKLQRRIAKAKPIGGEIPIKPGKLMPLADLSLPKKEFTQESPVKPMLAREMDKVFSDREWIYEMKWDGYRAIAEAKNDSISLYSRNGISFSSSYPLVVNALKILGINAIIDGEVVVLDEDGKSNFQKLQHYKRNHKYTLQFRVFDVLAINGRNTCELPLIERKELLRKLLPENEIVKFSDHIEENGEEFFEMARERDLEGIMAKKADSLYYPGTRTSEWLKIKHHKTQEAVIAGFTAPAGSRKHFGALILGIYEGEELQYIGHTGSGFNDRSLKEIGVLLKPLAQNNSPFSAKVKTNMPATWVRPLLVCEIKFTEWTRDGSLRHPIFLRLREDKKAKEVTRNGAKTVGQIISDEK